MPDNTLSTLDNIKTKVRRLTRSPSVSQLSDAVLESYINTFVLYDFPENLKLFSLLTTLSFYTKPYVDRYSTNTADQNDPLYNFKNQYTSVHKPVYIAGNQVLMSTSREQFYGLYPIVNSLRRVGTGTGALTAFAGVLPNFGMPVPIIRGSVLFSAVDVNYNALSVVDNPIDNSAVGNLVVPNSPAVVGAINYVTGLFGFVFPVAPLLDSHVNCQAVPFTPSRPQAILYYQDEFYVRPVPDQPYRITLECYTRPTELLAGATMPELSEWWQYISYGAAKKIFEDRLDTESINSIMPEYKNQERLVLRRSITIASNERVATIYTEQVGIGAGVNGFVSSNV